MGKYCSDQYDYIKENLDQLGFNTHIDPKAIEFSSFSLSLIIYCNEPAKELSVISVHYELGYQGMVDFIL
jgi:hypothetical protein